MKNQGKILIVGIISAIICYSVISAEEPKSKLPRKQDKETTMKTKPPFTISKETTYLTEPLREDGYVDYVAALNKICQKGVTPENNAVVPLLEAVGPGIIDKENREQFFRMLGIKPLPEKGDYFIPFEDFLKQAIAAKGKEAETGESTDEEKQSEAFYKAMENPWSEEQYPVVAAWLKANQKPLAKIREAAPRPKFYSPMISKGKGPQVINIQLYAVEPSRDCARLLMIRAMFDIKTGKLKDAKDNIVCATGWQDS